MVCIIFGYNLGLITLNLSLDNLELSLLFSENCVILAVPKISLKSLDKGKLYVYHQDKNTIAFVFNNYLQAARVLSPNRVAHLSDSELNCRKNLQHIIRVINKGTLTQPFFKYKIWISISNVKRYGNFFR